MGPGADRRPRHQHTVVLFDNRSIATSVPSPVRGLTIARMADDTAALIDALGLGKADVLLDIVEPPANSRMIARRIPGAKLTLYRGAGHAHLFQFHGRYAGEVNGFLAAPR
jgi:pimeloyl-ACP methyl ester carboxylesterase